MRILFLAAFIGGLLLAVFAMLHGVEHLRRNRKRAPSPFFNLPNVAAFAIGLGATGYPLTTHTSLPTWSIVLLAIVGAGIAISAMTLLLAQWALRGISRVSTADTDEEIQGTFARVVREIPAFGRGRISFERAGQIIECDAQSISSNATARGTEVVIDRIENGVAFVEEWSVVEQRL